MKKGKSPSRYSAKERFDYWFDNKMAKGSLGLIRTLLVFTLLLAVIVAGLIIMFHFYPANDDEGPVSFFAIIWDSIATLINAWMPSSEDGPQEYIALMAISALAGVLFTSVLIGIVTSSIEEKIDELKKGNSLVIEKDHTVVLGYAPGEYTLINQLILAAGGQPACVVLADNTERSEIEQDLLENVDVPSNFRIVCRTVDITDPSSIEKCSLDTCKTVIISPTEDTRTVKAVLAVTALLQREQIGGVRVNAIVTKDKYRFPPSLAEAHNISTLQTNDILAKMIAHSCTQAGLSETFREVFNFEGSEFYLIEAPEACGWSFEELTASMDRAVPAGIFHEGKSLLNPPLDYCIQDGDRIIVFSEDNWLKGAIAKQDLPSLDNIKNVPMILNDHTDTVIIGHNETLPIILQELPENVTHVFLAGQTLTEEERNDLQQIAEKRDLQIKTCHGNLRSEKFLSGLARMAEHIVILSDHEKDPEDADMETIFLLLNLRDIRTRYGLGFNITVEMQKEHNQCLVGTTERTDFLVSSSMSSLILAQLAESPELISVFRELLSNKGNELYLKNALAAELTGTYSIQQLRSIVLHRGYILLGYMIADKGSVFNPPLYEEITLREDDSIIVLGEN